MMLGMPGRVDGNEAQIADCDFLSVVRERSSLLSGTGRNSPHSVSIWSP